MSCWLRFNINESVRVKLTDIGLAEFRRQREELNARLRPDVAKASTEPKLDVEGYYTNPMWVIINDFGHLVGMSLRPPFETEILLPADKLENKST